MLDQISTPHAVCTPQSTLFVATEGTRRISPSPSLATKCTEASGGNNLRYLLPSSSRCVSSEIVSCMKTAISHRAPPLHALSPLPLLVKIPPARAQYFVACTPCHRNPLSPETSPRPELQSQVHEDQSGMRHTQSADPCGSTPACRQTFFKINSCVRICTFLPKFTHKSSTRRNTLSVTKAKVHSGISSAKACIDEVA